jgi:hypothetical protein
LYAELLRPTDDLIRESRVPRFSQQPPYVWPSGAHPQLEQFTFASQAAAHSAPARKTTGFNHLSFPLKKPQRFYPDKLRSQLDRNCPWLAPVFIPCVFGGIVRVFMIGQTDGEPCGCIHFHIIDDTPKI